MSEKINNEKRVASIFVDESGNKFDEHMFSQSPFFVYAWLLLTKDQKKILNFAYQKFFTERRYPKLVSCGL